MSKQLLKKVVIGILLLPVGFFLIFTIGETISGDISGLSHLIQAAPFAIIAILVWKKL